MFIDINMAIKVHSRMGPEHNILKFVIMQFNEIVLSTRVIIICALKYLKGEEEERAITKATAYKAFHT